MGISSSSTNRRNNQNYLLPPPPQQPYYYPPEPPNAPYSAHPVHNSYYAPQPPPPPFNCAYYNRTPYYANQAGGWPAITAPVGVSQAEPPPPPYVDHQNAKKVRNDVNLRKDTVKLEVDPQNPDHHLVSFVFDALFDGSIKISYFAKEESNCVFVPVFPEMYELVTFPFQKGLGQKFLQPSGTGIDLGFFALDDLSKPSSAEDVFPLVISSETSPDSSSAAHKQITQAVIEKNGSNTFQVKVVRQILWIDGVRYELRDLYGVASTAADEEFEDDNNSGKECVICLTQPKDTAILPCRHMCMCSGCAKALRLRSNKCPICRQPMEELIEIEMKSK